MSTPSFILLLLAILYIFGAVFEFPIFFDANPKTRWLMQRIGKKNLKIVFFVLAAIFIILAIMFK